MKRIVLALYVAAAAAMSVPRAAAAQDTLTAEQIVDAALDTNTIGFQSGEVTMTLFSTDADGEERTRSLAVRGLNQDGLNRALVRVTNPATQAGQTYLFRENTTGEDDVWVFLPALDDAPRRISGAQKEGSFMGTHFTYADLESRDLRQATYTRLADESIGVFDCYVIDAVPNPGTEVEYASARMWIRKSDSIPLRTRFFDAAGDTLKTLYTEETALADDGRVYVRRLTLRPAAGGSTTMQIDSADFNASVSATEMTPQAMVQ